MQWDNRGLYALQGPEAAQVLQRLVPSVNLAKMSFGDAANMKVCMYVCIKVILSAVFTPWIFQSLVTLMNKLVRSIL